LVVAYLVVLFILKAIAFSQWVLEIVFFIQIVIMIVLDLLLLSGFLEPLSLFTCIFGYYDFEWVIVDYISFTWHVTIGCVIL
jgi:hypothetical protein